MSEWISDTYTTVNMISNHIYFVQVHRKVEQPLFCSVLFCSGPLSPSTCNKIRLFSRGRTATANEARQRKRMAATQTQGVSFQPSPQEKDQVRQGQGQEQGQGKPMFQLTITTTVLAWVPSTRPWQVASCLLHIEYDMYCILRTV